jgi:hypothetical protein
LKDKVLREQIITLLEGGEAHSRVEDAVRDFPRLLTDGKVGAIPHTPWQLLEHMRIAQWDILEFCRDPSHISPDFPTGYWPSHATPPTPDSWGAAVESFLEDLRAVQALVLDVRIELSSEIPHGEGQTFLREALLVADHNSYHLGQLMAIRRGLEGRGG